MEFSSGEFALHMRSPTFNSYTANKINKVITVNLRMPLNIARLQ